MTLDHIGLFLEPDGHTQLAYYFRLFGRLALPIFIFLIVEGVRHTKSKTNYLIRIGILEVLFLIGQIVFFKVSDFAFASPIFDIFIVLLTLILINKKDKFSFFALIPIIYSIVCFISQNTSNFIPFYLQFAYPLFSMCLGLGFYFVKPFSAFYLKSSDSTKNFVGTTYQDETESIISAVFLLIVTLIFYIVNIIFGISYSPFSNQIFAALAAIPIYMYSGKIGYNRKWFKIGCYIYMPLHLLLISLIFVLL